MHSKRHYKICICSVILGQLQFFRNYQGFSIIFPKILDAIWRITKERIFLIPRSITFLSPKILGFLFSTKNTLTWGVNCEKLSITFTSWFQPGYSVKNGTQELCFRERKSVYLTLKLAKITQVINNLPSLNLMVSVICA